MESLTEGLAEHVGSLYDWNLSGNEWTLERFRTLEEAITAVRGGNPSKPISDGHPTTAIEVVLFYELEGFVTPGYSVAA